MVGEQRDVFAALAQGGHADGNHAQPVVEVFAERAVGDLFVEIAVGGGNDPHVDGDLAGAAHRTHGALLQHAQQLDLHGHGHLADFVEEDRALIGDFEESALVLVGSGECAFDVSEEFAFEQRLGKCAAVDRDEAFGRARRAGVDGAGYQFFSGAAFAVDQDRALRRRDRADRLLQLFEVGLIPTMLSSELRVAASRLRAKFWRLSETFSSARVIPSLTSSTRPGTLADVVGGAAGFHGLQWRRRSRRRRS